MRNKVAITALLITGLLLFEGCKDKSELTVNTDVAEEKIQIGLSFDSFVIERWQRDRDVFVSTAQDLGAEVNVQNANGNIEEQISQIEYFIDKEMDVIVVIPVDSEACSEVLSKAKDAGIIVVAYDRLLRNCEIDLYISFDNEKVGTLMAETLVNGLPEGGNIITIFGPTSDHNVRLMEQGFRDVLEGSGLSIIYSVNAKGWLAEEAFIAVNAALLITEDIDGVMCGNDNLASQAVVALSENRLAGKVILTGQDAELAACQRIVEGTQTMTVYKPVDKLAKAAAEAAVKLAKGGKLNITATIDNGRIDVPYVKLEPIAVTKANMDEVIIDGGFQQEDEVYLNVPDQVD
ncbi:MAG: ABC-type xylose transport system, periplasmic component [Herbinix sp.]|jgi:D-xylose transport system substrate-binding protein|nr:ABC-type xylose transport system, periplasmic component [Herbinix sp.]